MGDSADNYPGCPGVGEKTAVKLINEFGSCENLIENSNQLKGKMREKVEGAVEDIKIFKDLFELSDGQILLTPENCKLNINPNTLDRPGKLQKPINSKKAKKK